MAALLEAVRTERNRTPSIRALLVVGPFGPLWQYNVALFMEEGNGIRANLLAMPHARITWKATARIEADEFRKIADVFHVATDSANIADEASVLFVTWADDVETVRSSNINLYKASSDRIAKAIDVIEALSGTATTTYSNDLGDETPIFRCSEPH